MFIVNTEQVQWLQMATVLRNNFNFPNFMSLRVSFLLSPLKWSGNVGEGGGDWLKLKCLSILSYSFVSDHHNINLHLTVYMDRYQFKSFYLSNCLYLTSNLFNQNITFVH